MAAVLVCVQDYINEPGGGYVARCVSLILGTIWRFGGTDFLLENGKSYLLFVSRGAACPLTWDPPRGPCPP